VTHQRQRLLEAYLAEVINLAAFQRQDRTLTQQEADLRAREREVAAQGERLVQVSAIARSVTQVSEQLRVGLDQASFEQRRQLVELLIDRVVVTNGKVEIRYVIPTTPAAPRHGFVTCVQTISTWLRCRYTARSKSGWRSWSARVGITAPMRRRRSPRTLGYQ
jgi:hypothetical protein